MEGVLKATFHLATNCLYTLAKNGPQRYVILWPWEKETGSALPCRSNSIELLTRNSERKFANSNFRELTLGVVLTRL